MTIEIICGDNREILDELYHEDESFDLVFADVPYPGMVIHDGSNERLTHKSFFTKFGGALRLCARGLNDTGVMALLLNSKCKQAAQFQFDMYEFMRNSTDLVLIDQLMWMKPSVIPSKLSPNSRSYRQMFDPVLIFARDINKYKFNLANLESNEIKQINGYSSMHVNVVRDTSGRDAAYKAAVKKSGIEHKGRCPESVVEYIIETYTDAGDLVVDPFLGSGTTMAVAKRLDRDGIGIDINPDNVKLAEAYVNSIKDPA